MNQMNMAGANPNAGGPVGGYPMVNSGSSAPRNEVNNNDAVVAQLNTYIYDYFIKKGYHDCARALAKDDSVPLNTTPQSKQPRRDGEVNGVDGDTIMTDSKDDAKTKIPDDLPRPNLNGDPQQTSFLFDWWNLFWDIFSAQRRKGRSGDASTQYMQHTQSMSRMRDQQHQTQMMRHPMMHNGQFPMRGMRPGMMPPNLPKSIMQNQNMTQQQLAQFQKNQALMHHQQQQMQREQSQMEMNGHRPQTPSAENAPSPAKRPRLEESQGNGQPARAPGQPMPGQPQQMNTYLLQQGINPRNLTPQQFQALQAAGPAAQQKSVQVYNQSVAMQQQRSNMNQGMPSGMMNPNVMPNQDMMQLHDGQGMIPVQDYYPNGQMAQMRPGMQNTNGQPGNHALQDYQMQLMLLEQQNKRRLMMARAEQNSISTRTEGTQPGQPGMSSQPNLAPGTSPEGSRTGASPNPNDQMKRGTPKMPQSGLPGSPNVGDAMVPGRGSPAAMNFGGQMPPDMNAAFFNMKGMPEAAVGPNGMRPPSSNPAYSGPQVPQPMDAMSRAQAGQPGAPNRIPNGGWPQGPQGQPMVPPQQPGQAQPAGTPQERNAMPPPQAPSAATGNATGRTQTSSPQPGPAAPPTPQQSTKPAPKSKKEGNEKARKRPAKKGAAATAAATTAATPSSEAEPPPTPTTPITPGHQNSFNKNGNSNAQQPTSAPGPQSLGPTQQQQQQPPPQPPQPPQQAQQQQPQQDPSQGFPDMGDSTFNLDFGALDNPDILENFDFDSFLNTDDPSGFTFDPSMSYPDGVEAGEGI